MTLTPFEWALIIAIGGLLLAALSFLVAQAIKLFSQRMTEMAALIAEVTRSLQTMNETNLREHAEFATTSEVGATHRRLHEKIEEIARGISRIEAGMVTHEQCLQRCAAS